MEGDGNGSANNFTFVLTGKGSAVDCILNPALYLNGEYEMCMLSLQTYNSIPNVTNKNNVLTYSVTPVIGNIGMWNEIVIPEGTYDIMDLQEYIDEQLRVKEGETHEFVLTPNSNTMKVLLKSSVSIDFGAKNSIGSLLGFHKQKIARNISVYSDEVVDINGISAIDIMCNIVDGSYINGESSHVLYHFYPNVPPGFKIIEVPEEKIYMPVNTNVLSDIIIRAVDQTGKAIDLRDEEMTIYLRIRRR